MVTVILHVFVTPPSVKLTGTEYVIVEVPDALFHSLPGNVGSTLLVAPLAYVARTDSPLTYELLIVMVLPASAQLRFALPLSAIDCNGFVQLQSAVALMVSPATVLEAETEHLPDVDVVAAAELEVVPDL